MPTEKDSSMKPYIELIIEEAYNQSVVSGEMKKRAIEFLSSNGSIHRMRVKYKPKEVTAYFVQSEHVEAGEKKKTTKSGWLLPGPGRAVFYIPEDQFSAFFEIIKDEGRIIAQGEHA